MNKPVKISIAFVCLLVIAGGIYFWQNYKTDELNRQNEVLFSQKLAQAYQIKEQPEGTRVIATVGGEQITYGDLVVEATRGEVMALAEGVTVPFSERVQSAFNTLGSASTQGQSCCRTTKCLSTGGANRLPLLSLLRLFLFLPFISVLSKKFFLQNRI